MTERLDALYRRIPQLRCLGRCQESCGPIPAGPAERARVQAAGVTLPMIETRAQGQAALRDPTFTCPALNSLGLCRVHEVRPMSCRLWGVVESMPCPWGCVPTGGRMPDWEGHRLLEEAMTLPVESD